MEKINHFGIKNSCTEDFALYERGREYNRIIGYYDTVNKNERFYRGDQWHGINSGGLPTPVFNIFKRVINYFVSTIMSQKLAFRYGAEGMYIMLGDGKKREIEEKCATITSLNYRYDKDKIESLLSRGLFEAAVSGDFFLYTYWDASKKTAQGYSGDFATCLIDSTNVFFGDVNSSEIEEQPYIILSGRDQVDRLRAEAAENGAKRDDIDLITADDDTSDESGDFGKNELSGTKCTYLIKLYKKGGTVRYRKSTRRTVICHERDTGLRLYPVTLMNWERVKNRYHGQAVATDIIDNQTYINKAFAMVMKHMTDVSFSKILYNSNIIDEWTNEIGEAIAVNGPTESAALRIEPGTLQSGFLDVISLTLSVTKELLGATDAALGNVRPENTSAIIALQQASGIPLENQRRGLYETVERLGMIWLDFVLNYYDSSRVFMYTENGVQKGEVLTHQGLNEVLFDCRVDVGASSYWSELAAVTTLDNLLASGKISFEQYLKRLPDGFIPAKDELISEIKAHAGSETASE
ncbi:MAG: hypothetical protein VB118_12125 [Oscillospiraceae bacterium]|nr:hypothetical protein [Oscillospiraceae bacterium]